MSEVFRPISNTPPDTVINTIKFYGRMIIDLQIFTIFKDLKKTVVSFEGNILDIGCGLSPYKFLLKTGGGHDISALILWMQINLIIKIQASHLLMAKKFPSRMTSLMG